MTSSSNSAQAEEASGASSAPGPSFTLSPLLVTLDPRISGEAESYRALRTHIVARHIEQGRRALAICAPTPNTGCSRVSANLAVSLSQIGLKTLLIDANLRTPSIDKLFAPSEPVPGLEQCLSSRGAHYSEFVVAEVLPDLSIMFSGGAPANAQELLAGDHFAEMMNLCMRDYAVTILDTPAASRVSDAIRVSNVVGYSAIVAKRDKTLMHDVKTLVAQLEGNHVKVVGTVLFED
jgi:protein-tyrosine kinase